MPAKAGKKVRSSFRIMGAQRKEEFYTGKEFSNILTALKAVAQSKLCTETTQI